VLTASIIIDLMTEAVITFETSENGSHLHNRRGENLKSQQLFLFSILSNSSRFSQFFPAFAALKIAGNFKPAYNRIWVSLN
jgi:hypothetical protein